MDDALKIVEGLIDYLEDSEQMDLLPEVVEQLEKELLRQTRKVRLVSASPLTTGEVKEIGAALAERFGPELILETEVDPKLVGGFKVEFNDQLIDLSVLGRLRKVKKRVVSS